MPAALTFFAAVLLAIATTARADNITYSINDVEYNMAGPGLMNIDATITTDGTLGDWSVNPGSIVGSTLTITYEDSQGLPRTFTASSISWGCVDWLATPYQLTLPLGNNVQLAAASLSGESASIDWLNGYMLWGDPIDDYRGEVDYADSSVPWAGFNTVPVPWVYGTETEYPFEPRVWVIAGSGDGGSDNGSDGGSGGGGGEAPEPSTLVLLGIGAVSMMAYAWRKRTRTA